MSPGSESKQILIIGGGIIGCTTAYYITRHASFDVARDSVTVVEAADVAGGASGKAGGLVATWAYPKELVAVSYEEHRKLAEEHGGATRWGYRIVGCGQWEGRGAAEHSENMDGLHERTKKRGKRSIPPDLDWIRADLTESYVPFEGETAQVHPFQFTTSMLALAQERGAQLVKARVTKINSGGGRVTSVQLASGETLPATHIVLAAGPWAPRVLPALEGLITASRAHSITLRPPPTMPISAYCVFTEIALPDGRTAAPEIYARPNDEVYACFGSDSLTLPETTAQVVVDEEKCEAIRTQVAAISPALAKATPLVRQACYLPNVATGGGPIIGEIPGMAGLVIGVGHTCWGICNGPGTGKALSELVLDGKISCANFLHNTINIGESMRLHSEYNLQRRSVRKSGAGAKVRRCSLPLDWSYARVVANPVPLALSFAGTAHSVVLLVPPQTLSTFFAELTLYLSLTHCVRETM